MRIAENRPERLVIEERPWLMGLMFAVMAASMAFAALERAAAGKYVLALVLAGISAASVFAIYALVERICLVFDRAAGTVEIRRRGLGGSRSERHPLAALTGVEVHTDSDSEGTTHRLALTFTGRAAPLPLTRYYSSGDGARRAADAARAWLVGPGAPPRP